MSEKWPTATFTSEFGHEFEAERATWLRRRFLRYAGVVGGFSLLSALANGLLVVFGSKADSERALNLTVSVAATVLFAAAFIRVWRQPGGKESLLRLAATLIIVNGLIQLISGVIGTEIIRPQIAASRDPDVPPPTAMIAGVGLAQIFLTHFVACLFLPWTPRECFRPLIPLLGAFAIIEIVYMRHAPVSGLVSIALSPLIGLPGAGICWWRHSRFRDQFFLRVLRGRYAELKAELTNARTIHESLFPKPCNDGAVRFSYVYEPMRQIGGDYLYCCFTPAARTNARPGERVLNLAVIDVTGHGIPAALTVNRLHGELERIFAEHPEASPGDVLALLNRYVHLTLATHSVYVTAICFRADPGAGTLEYASGGHPPAFLRAVDGTLEQLDSTTFVLGACAGADFRSEPRTLRFTAGDTLIAYTDGATEARDIRGRFLGVAGIQRLIATGRPDLDGGWPATILRAVEQHRQGPAADDTLVIEIVLPLDLKRTASAAPVAAQAAS